jgi:hypothetical protein
MNLNDYVRVKLTDVGMAEYARIYDSTVPNLDDEGFYRTQFWSLMEDFGHLCGLGRPVPFETDFEVESA